MCGTPHRARQCLKPVWTVCPVSYPPNTPVCVVVSIDIPPCHCRQQQSANEMPDVSIPRFHHCQWVSRSTVQSRLARSTTTVRPVSRFPPSNRNHCSHLQPVKRLKFPAIVPFCAAFPPLTCSSSTTPASKLLIEQRRRQCRDASNQTS